MEKLVEQILTPGARDFLDHLHRAFNIKRERCLENRKKIQQQIDAGENPTFLKATESIRNDPSWKVSKPPQDLSKRLVEITGPCERKMMINAFNSGADVFMADLEDALSPTWENVLRGQQNLYDAVRKNLHLKSPEGKIYKLNDTIATLMVRPRGWHLVEQHYFVGDEPISASLFDFGLFFYHNAEELLSKGTGPYFYLPKMENAEEAALWAEVFHFSETHLNIPLKSIKVTVLIETILAAFQMEEILYELKDYILALNAGRWDYIFSIIKKFSSRKEFIFPNRGQITMTVPFMRAYTTLLVQTCHKRGAYALGGMSAFVPSRKDEELNAKAMAKVKEDKEREVNDGFDGSWVAHPDLVPICKEAFSRKVAVKEKTQTISPDDLINFTIPQGTITQEGIEQNVDVALEYLQYWLKGVGAVAIHNLMEDAATAEISRAQLWQWIHHGAKISGTDQSITADAIIKLIDAHEMKSKNKTAGTILHEIVVSKHFTEFLTIKAYPYL